MARDLDFIQRGAEILAAQPKIVIALGEDLHPTVLEGREHITDDELESLVSTLRATGLKGPLDEPITIAYKTETRGDSLYSDPNMRDVICSKIATADTLTGYQEVLPSERSVGVPVLSMEGGLWTPPNQRLAKLALNHPWAAYEQSQKDVSF